MTERQAIELALSRSAYKELEQGRLSVAESAVAEASLVPNPGLALEQERVPGPAGRSVETTARISQTFDISGRRILRRQAAESRLDAARFDEEERRRITAAEVRRAFAEALHRQQVRTALDGWIQRIESAATVVTRLASAGEASGYDRRRLERESRAARARAASTGADYIRMREVLAGLVGKPTAASTLVGDLLPAPPPALDSAQTMLRARPELASLNAKAEAFDRERSAAERGWIPDVTLELGQKRVEEPGRSDHGPIVGISVPIPLFDRGQPGQQRARAHASMLRAEYALLLAKSDAELRGVWRQFVELRRIAESFRWESLTASRDLTRIAEAAYRAGEGNVLELLDAYRGDLDAEITTLDLELRARLSRIELDALSGARFHEN